MYLPKLGDTLSESFTCRKGGEPAETLARRKYLVIFREIQHSEFGLDF